MSLSSVEPANQICYIEKPPKPLGSAIADFIKEEVKAGKSGSVSGTVNTQNTSLASATSINGVGQITGQLISTTA